MNSATLSPFVSSKFRFWAFISMVLLVFVHGYNLHERYLQPWTLPGEPLTLTAFTEYFLANGIFRFRIPMLFIISGYLFAMHDHIPYKKRIGKRARTLVVPYFAWSALGLAFTWILEWSAVGRSMVAGSHVVQIDATRALLHDYRWYELLTKFVFFPVPFQLWFIRVLFIYNLAYPALRWCVMHPVARWIFFPVVALMWLGTMGFVFFEGEGLLFFSLGILMQKRMFDIETPGKGLHPLWWGAAFVIVAAGKTLLAFNGSWLLVNIQIPALVVMHKLVVVSGLIACWYGLDPLVRWCMARPWFVWLSAFAFMIYAMHSPLVSYSASLVLAWLEPVAGARFLGFILLPLAVISLSILAGALLRRVLPKVYGLLTGGRGM
jgi:fucose 4-O-acetylase-like acetyltransferase